MTVRAIDLAKQFAGFSSAMRLPMVAASPYLPAVFDAGEAMSFLKRGSFRSGSNIGSSWSSAGVSGTFAALSGR